LHGRVSSAAFSPDGRKVIASVQGKVFLMDATTGDRLRVFTHGRIWNDAEAVAFSPDGRFVLTGWRDGDSVLWDAVAGQRIRVLRRPKDRALCVSFISDGQRLAVSYESGLVAIWDLRTGRKLDKSHEGVELKGERDLPTEDMESPDGRWLLGGLRSSSAFLMDTRTQRRTPMLHGRAWRVNWAVFSQTTPRLATADDDGVRMWSTKTGRELASLVSANRGRDWLTVTPRGYFHGSHNGHWLIRWRVGEAEYPVEKYKEHFCRPDIVERILREQDDNDQDGRLGTGGDFGPPSTSSNFHPAASVV
jgi:WD40 repeat protein